MTDKAVPMDEILSMITKIICELEGQTSSLKKDGLDNHASYIRIKKASEHLQRAFFDLDEILR